MLEAVDKAIDAFLMEAECHFFVFEVFDVMVVDEPVETACKDDFQVFDELNFCDPPIMKLLLHSPDIFKDLESNRFLEELFNQGLLLFL